MLNIISELIQNDPKGSISYSDFMKVALYHPDQGYYMKSKEKVGKEGDFYTSSNVGTIFGKLFSRFFFQITRHFDFPPVICEFGSGNGRFAKAVITEWKQLTNEKLIYYSVESSPFHQQLQKELLQEEESFFLFNDDAELKEQVNSFKGIIFTNEFFDAFPVDVVERKNGIVHEARVTVTKAGNLKETLEICENEALVNWLEKNHFPLQEGQRIEIPLQMEKWIKNVGAWIEKGLILTADYGYFKEEWQRPEHRKGSLRGYFQHTLVQDPLKHPGHMDLTTHIHFDSLLSTGKEIGFKNEGFERQREFLVKLGILEYLQENTDTNPFSEVSRQNRAIRSLLMDGGISSMFYIFIQQKGLKDFVLENYLQ